MEGAAAGKPDFDGVGWMSQGGEVVTTATTAPRTTVDRPAHSPRHDALCVLEAMIRSVLVCSLSSGSKVVTGSRYTGRSSVYLLVVSI
jgi:hypothetical protein